jgi:hypothetical protein
MPKSQITILKEPNKQQWMFINAYLSNQGNALSAYKTAGYKINSNARMYAYELLQRPYIKAAIEHQLFIRQKHQDTKVLINLDTMTDKISDLAERCFKAGDRANELAAYTLLMRSRGLLTDNVNVGDTDRLNQIDRKILADAKIYTQLPIVKTNLLTSGRADNARVGDVNNSIGNTENDEKKG